MSEVSTNMNSLRPMSGPVDTGRSGQISNRINDPGFRDQLSALQNSVSAGTAPTAANAARLKFSNHAVDRMQARGVRFSPQELGRIEAAIEKAASKGAKNTLLLSDNAALIVSVKDKTVVTVMDKANLKENVFTNIDSTVVV